MVRHRIGADDITKGSIAELEVSAGVWERSETGRRIGIEYGRMLDVV